MIEHIAKQADVSKAAAGRALEAVIGGIKTTLKKGGSRSKLRPLKSPSFAQARH